MYGTLYLVATPIGNLEDITFRAIKVLNEVDLIAAEDTRVTKRLLNHFKIEKPLTSYYEHNKKSKGEYLINELLKGENIALVTDAGTPGISDPGEDLVIDAIKNNIKVSSIPGACAAINALVTSGLSTSKFSFEGFLEKNKTDKNKTLELIKYDTRTLIFYEAPHKLINTLESMNEILGDRQITLAREMTKKFEEIRKTKICDALEYYNNVNPKGEFVLIVEGYIKEEIKIILTDEDIVEKVDKYIKEGIEKNEGIKRTAKDLEISKRVVYNLYNKNK